MKYTNEPLLSDPQEELTTLRSCLFGKVQTEYMGWEKAYSIRLPMRIASPVEVITDMSQRGDNKISKNSIVGDLIFLGLKSLISEISEEERNEFMQNVYVKNAEMLELSKDV